MGLKHRTVEPVSLTVTTQRHPWIAPVLMSNPLVRLGRHAPISMPRSVLVILRLRDRIRIRHAIEQVYQPRQ
jgi:hypothetical protein